MKTAIRSVLAKQLPEPIKVQILRGAQLMRHTYLGSKKVHYRSELQNIYHCAVHRTASQWIKSILFDEQVYQYCGLRSYDSRILGPNLNSLDKRVYGEFPKRVLVSTLYVHFDRFKDIPKREPYRACFVMRDPRDIVVSHYFSSRFSHTLMGDMTERRKLFEEISKEEGLIHTIRYLKEFGVFWALRSWNPSVNPDANCLVVRYEDLVGPNQFAVYYSLFKHFDIAMPDKTLEAVLAKYSFGQLSGRTQGESDVKSHYRKGQSGDWKNHFDESVLAEFYRVTGDLISVLGYEM